MSLQSMSSRSYKRIRKLFKCVKIAILSVLVKINRINELGDSDSEPLVYTDHTKKKKHLELGLQTQKVRFTTKASKHE